MSAEVTVVVDGRSARVPAGTSVAAVLALLGSGWSRISVRGDVRAPVCGMGICQECRLLVDGRQRLACQTVCAEGMRVDTGTRR